MSTVNIMSLAQAPLTIIVAATAKHGIGKNNGLPWPMLKKDMAYFARITKRVPILKDTASARSDTLKESDLTGATRNVVIMGRKTWDSIPSKRRPLADRINIIISTQDRSKLANIPDDVVVASDILSGLSSLEQLIKDGKSAPAGRIFVIGGSSIYKAALELPQTTRVLLTRIGKDYACDVFFPVALGDSAEGQSAWRRRSNAELEQFVGEDVNEGPQPQTVGDDEVSVDFQLYER